MERRDALYGRYGSGGYGLRPNRPYELCPAREGECDFAECVAAQSTRTRDFGIGNACVPAAHTLQPFCDLLTGRRVGLTPP